MENLTDTDKTVSFDNGSADGVQSITAPHGYILPQVSDDKTLIPVMPHAISASEGILGETGEDLSGVHLSVHDMNIHPTHEHAGFKRIELAQRKLADIKSISVRDPQLGGFQKLNGEALSDSPTCFAIFDEGIPENMKSASARLRKEGASQTVSMSLAYFDGTSWSDYFYAGGESQIQKILAWYRGGDMHEYTVRLTMQTEGGFDPETQEPSNESTVIEKEPSFTSEYIESGMIQTEPEADVVWSDYGIRSIRFPVCVQSDEKRAVWTKHIGEVTDTGSAVAVPSELVGLWTVKSGSTPRLQENINVNVGELADLSEGNTARVTDSCRSFEDEHTSKWVQIKYADEMYWIPESTLSMDFEKSGEFADCYALLIPDQNGEGGQDLQLVILTNQSSDTYTYIFPSALKNQSEYGFVSYASEDGSDEYARGSVAVRGQADEDGYLAVEVIDNSIDGFIGRTFYVKTDGDEDIIANERLQLFADEDGEKVAQPLWVTLDLVTGASLPKSRFALMGNKDELLGENDGMFVDYNVNGTVDDGEEVEADETVGEILTADGKITRAFRKPSSNDIGYVGVTGEDGIERYYEIITSLNQA